MHKISFGLLIVLLTLFYSCTKQIPNALDGNPGNAATVKVSNGWWVNISAPGLGNLTPTPTFFSTYNTAANTTDSLWLDDHGNGYGFKCTVALNYAALSFQVANSLNYYIDSYGDTNTLVTILNGKVLPKAGHSRAGNITDSIYMQAVFSDNPSDTFAIAGTARTGFIEDDY